MNIVFEFKADFLIYTKKKGNEDQLVEMIAWSRQTYKKSLRGEWMDIPGRGASRLRLYFDTEAEMAMFSLRWSEFIA